jgi:hypothetical protein
MRTRLDPDVVIASWLREEAPDRASDRLLEAARLQIASTNQRRSWWPARRIPRMTTAPKLAVAAAAVVAVAVAGINFLPGTGGPGGQRVPSPSPSISPSPAVSASPDNPSLQRGSVTFAGTNLHATVELPAGWESSEFGISNGKDADAGGLAAVFTIVYNTFAQPCTHTPRSKTVQQTVDSVAAALGEIPNTTATEPVRRTVAGKEATYIQLTLPDPLPCGGCNFYLWQDSPPGDWWALAGGEVIQIWIFEIEGQPVTIAARSWPSTSAETKAEFQTVLDSIVFEPAP